MRGGQKQNTKTPVKVKRMGKMNGYFDKFQKQQFFV
jgi:hypothetical protein